MVWQYKGQRLVTCNVGETNATSLSSGLGLGMLVVLLLSKLWRIKDDSQRLQRSFKFGGSRECSYRQLGK